MTTQQIDNKLGEFGVRIIKSDKDFVKENEMQLEYLLFQHKITSKVFKTAVKSGFHKIIVDSKKGQFINEGDENLKFLYAVDNWFLVANFNKKRLLLYKIE